MSNIKDLIMCPECLEVGTMDVTIRHKTAEAVCENCDNVVTDRVPYPKHRTDHEGYQYHFEIGSVRPLWTEDDDDITCSQEEWESKA